MSTTLHIAAGVALAAGLVATVGAASATPSPSPSPSPSPAPLRSKTVRVPVTRAPATNYHFSNMPVRAALVLLAEEGGFSLVVSDSVQGNVSLRLNNVTWEQALDIVLRLKGLQQRVQGTARTVSASEG